MNAESAAVRQSSPLGRRWGLRLLLGIIQIIGGLKRHCACIGHASSCMTASSGQQEIAA